MSLISQKDAARISRAIAAAEKKTSGEIVAVIAESSDGYIFIPFLWAALAALLVPLPFFLGWTWDVTHVYALQLAVFALGSACALLRPVRMLLVPGPVKRARAHRHAVEQFLARNLHTTKRRTGVLIFVSVAERFAEVIADQGIYDRAPPDTWEDIVGRLTLKIGEDRPADGFVEAVGEAGALLASHFPRGDGDANELPNRLIILE